MVASAAAGILGTRWPPSLAARTARKRPPFPPVSQGFTLDLHFSSLHKIQNIYDEVIDVPQSAKEDSQHRANAQLITQQGGEKTSEFSMADVSCDVISTHRLAKKKKKSFFFRSKIQRYVNCLASISNKQCEITQNLITLSAFAPLQRTRSLRQDQLTGRAVSQTTCTGTHPQHRPTQQCQHSLVLTLHQDVWFGFFILEEVNLNELYT